MTLPTLPVQKVYVAFNPTATVGGTTYNLQSAMTAPLSSAYWTDVTQYVQSFTTSSGKQHYLDRVEASTLKITFNGRDGYFLNGTTNGTAYILSPRTPIAVTGTWASTNHPVFFGLIDSIDEKIIDQLNFELDVNASDYTKFLAETYGHRPSFWLGYGTAATTWSRYRCNNTSSVVVTSANSTGSTIVYQSVNKFDVGDNVTVTGLGGLVTFNQSNATVTAATSSSFTISHTMAVATSQGTGVAYLTACFDDNAQFTGQFVGSVSYPANGAIIYDANGCVDLANGTTNGSGSILLKSYTTTQGSLEMWILGQSIGGGLITTVTDGSGATTLQLRVTADGNPYVYDGTTNYPCTPAIQVNDGYWHHVGLVSDGTGALHLFVDGNFSSINSGGYTGWKTSGNLIIGSKLNAQIDEIFITDNSSLATLVPEVQQRYRAGSLLQTGFPVTSNKVSSGQRIGEILCLAGWGSVTGGSGSALATITLTSNLFYVSNAYNTPVVWSDGATGQGYANVEPYYWDSPITNSTLLDLIQQITDTDIGLFYQSPDGNFHFYDQNYYGNWVFNPGPPITSSWTPSYTVPTSGQAWTDDNSGTYIYCGPRLQVTRDEVDVYTTIKITPQAGIDQIYENTAKENRWGKATLVKSSTVNSSLNDALSTAYFLGHLFQQPLTRVQAVELHGETSLGTNYPAMLGTKIGDVVLLKRTPPGAQVTQDGTGATGYVFQDFAVESIAHSFQADPGQWITTFTLDPYPVRS